MNVILNIIGATPFLSALLGVTFLFSALDASGAPQQAAAAAIAVGFAVIPHCLHGIIYRSIVTANRDTPEC